MATSEGERFRLAEDTGGSWGEYLTVAPLLEQGWWVVVPVGDGEGPLLHLVEAR